MPSVKFYLNNYRDRNGKLRVTEVGIMASFSTGKGQRFGIVTEEKVEPQHWDFVRQCVKRSHRHEIEINNYLSDYKRDLLNLWREHRANLTFEDFKTLVQQQANPTQKKTLFSAFDKFLEQHKEGSDIKTYQKYSQLKDLLTVFDRQKPIDLQRMDFNFYDSFKSFLFSQPNSQYKNHQLVKEGDYYTIQPGKGVPVPLLDNTVYKLLSNLKQFLNWAADRDYSVHTSYKKWSILTHRQTPISLKIKELEALESAILPAHLSIARDYLVFECRTGQRISDIKRFDLSQFNNNTWSFNPKKGNRINSKMVHVKFEGYCAPALKILEKHNFKLPQVSEQKLNKNIKAVCKAAGINSPVKEYHYSGAKRILIEGPKHEWISTHTGRRTFITIALQFMPPKLVKDLAGIKDYKTLRHYEGDSDSGIVSEQLRKMESNMENLKAG